MIGGLLVQALASPLADRMQRRVPDRPDPQRRPDRRAWWRGSPWACSPTWMLAIAALYQPELGMRRIVQRSALLPHDRADRLPQATLMNALQRIDPLPILPGFAGSTPPAPDPSLAGTTRRSPASTGSVRMVEGTACGLGLQGSGWVVRPGLRRHQRPRGRRRARHPRRCSAPDRCRATPIYVSGEPGHRAAAGAGLTARPLAAQPSARARPTSRWSATREAAR